MNIGWRSIRRTRGIYKVSNDGRVKNTRNGLIMKPCGNPNGYRNVKMSIDGFVISSDIHRLVAIEFLPNPENKPEVNHINGDKSDNRVENLEWSTRLENVKHSWERGLATNNHKKTPVYQFKLNGKLVTKFESLAEAFRKTGIRHIWESCNKKASHAGGYEWRYCHD